MPPSLRDHCSQLYPSPRRLCLALDLDGTLLIPGEIIPPDALAALQVAIDAGVAVVIATGRRYRAAQSAVANLPFPILLLSHNGALCREPHSHETFFCETFPIPLIRPIWEQLCAWNLDPVAHLAHHDQFPEIVTVAPRPGTFHAQNVAERYAGLAAILAPGDIPPDHVIQLLAFGEAEELAHAARQLEEQYNGQLYVHAMLVPQQTAHVLEILHPAGGKWPGVQRVAAAFGLGIADIIAVGDDANDLAMLTGAGLGVAMGNATPAARAAADVQVAANTAGGIAEVVERYVLPRIT